MIVPSFLLAVSALVWMAYAVVGFRVRRAVPIIERLAPASLARWPKISLVIPARNEATHVEEAVNSRLSEGYPNLEVVVVNDRSSDATGAIIDRLGLDDPRVIPIHLKSLPDGWLGKLHAMHQGLAAATGEWILLSDADVHLSPGTLRKVIAWAEANALDHIAALPTVWSTGIFLDSVMAFFVRVLFSASRPWKIADPASSVAMGCGAFNLMRRTAYERSPGFEWLKLEIGDDVALAQMLKLSGSRTAFLNGRNVVRLQFYESLSHMARNVEKAAGIASVGPSKLAIAALTIATAELAPFVLLGCPNLPVAIRAISAAICVMGITISAVGNRWMGQPVLPALLVPIGTSIAATLMLRAAVLARVRGGVYWRGTFYPLELLRSGSRLQLTRKSPVPAKLKQVRR